MERPLTKQFWQLANSTHQGKWNQGNTSKQKPLKSLVPDVFTTKFAWPSIALFLLFSPFINSHSQIKIEHPDSCVNAIMVWHLQNQASELQALNVYKEKKWYNLLPVPGIAYNFMLNRPMITVSMPDFISYINRKKELNYRIHKTTISTQQGLTRDTIAFKSAYKELVHLVQFYHQEKELIAADSLLLKIKIEENKRLQATTEDVLKLKLAIAEKQYHHSKSILAILSKVATLESYLHRSFKISLPFDVLFPPSGETQRGPGSGVKYD